VKVSRFVEVPRFVKVGVLGAAGRMGRQICGAVEAADGLELTAAVDTGDAREPLSACDVVVDFTHPDAVMDNIAWCVGAGLNMVVGTTGFTPERLATVRSLVDAPRAELGRGATGSRSAHGQADGRHAHGGVGDGRKVGVLIAPNFSIGAVLMAHFAEIAAPFFESAEIVELHHPRKADAPSGTAVDTARRMAAARAAAGVGAGPDATTQQIAGARGSVVDGIHVHALRLSGLTASQEVHLSSDGEVLVLRDDARDRSCFMPGILRAIRWVPEHPGLTVGLATVLGLV